VCVWTTGAEGPAGDKEAAGAISSTGTLKAGGTGLVLKANKVVCVARGSGILALAGITVGTVVTLAGIIVTIESGGGAGATAGVSVAKGRGKVAIAAGIGAVAEARDDVCVIEDSTSSVQNARGDPAATAGGAAGKANTGREVGVANSRSVTTCAGALGRAGAADSTTVESPVVPPAAQVTGRGKAALCEGRGRQGGKPAAARSRAAFSDFYARRAAAVRLFSK